MQHFLLAIVSVVFLVLSTPELLGHDGCGSHRRSSSSNALHAPKGSHTGELTAKHALVSHSSDIATSSQAQEEHTCCEEEEDETEEHGCCRNHAKAEGLEKGCCAGKKGDKSEHSAPTPQR